MFEKHININNLHHAYLIEGDSFILAKLFDFIEKNLNIKKEGNPDFYFKSYDSLKIDDARSLVEIKNEKSFGGGKKIVVIETNSFLREAQNVLLKMFEEPIKDTIFFLIIQNKNTLLPTLLSRLYFIPNFSKALSFEKEVESFLKIDLRGKIDFIKEFTAKDDEEEEGYIAPRNKALQFLDTLEIQLNQKEKKDYKIFDKIFEIRSALRDPSSSAKTLLEALALSIK